LYELPPLKRERDQRRKHGYVGSDDRSGRIDCQAAGSQSRRSRERDLRYNPGVAQTRRPKLGQHFLASAAYRRRIADTLELRADDLVIEIGAGRGAMTELLAARARRVIAIELDPTLAENLKERFRAKPGIDVFQADILAIDLTELCVYRECEECFIFGNLPYYITSPILHRLFAFAPWIRAMALLVQREVAERLTAAPGTRAYGYLSILAQLYAQPRIVVGVPPGAFSPAPKVHSALVDFQMTPKFPGWGSEDREKFLDFVKRCFAQKRKNLLNNLGGTYARERVMQALATLDLPPTVRGEELALDQLAVLFQRLF